MPKSARTRVSLTKTDLRTAAGLGLLEVLQSIADDGHLAPGEVDQLRSWLAEHADSNLPARTHLQQVVNEVLEDGVITDEEYALLHNAILRVLPRDIRSIAVLRRRERKAGAREAQRQQEAETRAREKAAKARNRPLERGDFMIAGATMTPDRRNACDYASPGDQVWLEREPDNPYDSNAILIEDDTGDELGYVPREYAADFAPLLDAGARQDFIIKKCLETASGRTVPVVRGALYAAGSSHGRSSPDERASSQGTVGGSPTRQSARVHPMVGCLMWASVLGLGILVAWSLLMP